MPKMAAKYPRAVAMALAKKISTACDQEPLYIRLGEKGLVWDSEIKEWLDLGNEPADEPTPDVLIRVWASSDKVGQAAQDLIDGLLMIGYEKIE